MEKIDLEEIGDRLKQDLLVEALPDCFAAVLRQLEQAETLKRIAGES